MARLASYTPVWEGVAVEEEEDGLISGIGVFPFFMDNIL
jgi:hypothetical protein